MKLQKVTYQNHRKCSLRTSTKGRPFRTFNSYSFNVKGMISNRRKLAIVRTELLAREANLRFPNRSALYFSEATWVENNISL